MFEKYLSVVFDGVTKDTVQINDDKLHGKLESLWHDSRQLVIAQISFKLFPMVREAQEDVKNHRLGLKSDPDALGRLQALQRVLTLVSEFNS